MLYKETCMSLDEQIEIDYLPADKPIAGQNLVLVSIVGPENSKGNKCDVWAVKVRGVANSKEQAEKMTEKIMKYDNKFDILSLDVGKFFPVGFDMADLDQDKIIYQNDKMNALMKDYLETREKADLHHQERLNRARNKQLLKEEQTKLNDPTRKEHPVAIVQRIEELEKNIKELEQEIIDKNLMLKNARTKLTDFTDTEKQEALFEVEQSIKQTSKNDINAQKTLEKLREELTKDLTEEQVYEAQNYNEIKIKDLKEKVLELNKTKTNVPQNVVGLIDSEIDNIIAKIKELENENDVKNYINKHYF